MDLNEITPMILTYNEQANLERTLRALHWAKQILIVDSYSTDDTLAIAGKFPQVRIIQRKFDHFADQCNFGLAHIETSWVLSLDADYQCSDQFADEIQHLAPGLSSGFEAPFRYGVFGTPLRATLYPPRVVLYRRELARYRSDGHAHKVEIQGIIGKIRTPILHDDRKSLTVWFASQVKYASLEADKLQSSVATCGWKDQVRRTVILAPVLTLVYCLFVKRLILDGRKGLFYTMQRVLAELILGLTLLERKLSRSAL